MPRRREQQAMNRGRFQAQGDRLEKSTPWAQEEIPTKADGHIFLEDLKGQLAPAELSARVSCLEKAKNWIDEAPRQGYVVVTPIKTSFQPYPPLKDIRVDGELYSGVAFKDR